MREDLQREGVGKSTYGRREFDRLMKSLVPANTAVVTKLDRLPFKHPKAFDARLMR